MALLGWITIPNKQMSNLDLLACTGMASVKRIHATSKIQDGSRRGLLLSFTVSLRIFFLTYPQRLQALLFVPWSLYRSCQGHHELYLSPAVFMKDQLLLRASNTCYSASMTPEPRLHSVTLTCSLCNNTTVKLYNKQIYVNKHIPCLCSDLPSSGLVFQGIIHCPWHQYSKVKIDRQIDRYSVYFTHLQQ